LKGYSWVSLKGKHPIKDHICCVSGVVKKLCARQEVPDSSSTDVELDVGAHGLFFFSVAGPSRIPSPGCSDRN
jgi:hypothetical protein